MESRTTEFESNFSTLILGVSNLVINAMEGIRAQLIKSQEMVKELTEANNKLLKENDQLSSELNQHPPAENPPDN